MTCLIVLTRNLILIEHTVILESDDIAYTIFKLNLPFGLLPPLRLPF